MLLRIQKNAMTLNLDRFNYIRADGSTVEAGSGLCTIKIAKCETEKDAISLEQAIYEAWMRPCHAFSVDNWCAEHNIAFE